MQNRRVIAVVIGAVLALGAISPAQDLPRVLVRGDSVFREQPGQTDFTGNARITVNGVMVEADRIVIQDREVRFEGNVRLALPRGARVSEMKEVRLTPMPRQNP